jgi:hypothetical protein
LELQISLSGLISGREFSTLTDLVTLNMVPALRASQYPMPPELFFELVVFEIDQLDRYLLVNAAKAMQATASISGHILGAVGRKEERS